MLSGKDPRAMADGNWYKFLGQAATTGGTMGIYGDFLADALTGRIDRLVMGAMGPTIGPLLEMGVDPLYQASRAIQGKETNLLVQGAKNLKGLVPGGISGTPKPP